jgi:uncharacterized protein (DUF342 family)
VQQQILVAKIPPEACKAGRTVTGKEIPASQRELPLPKAGMNVAATEDGHALMSLINGHPVLADGCLRVDPTYTLEGGVDFSVGNITCIGHLVITGDVKSGFSVKGAQDVTVYGVVEGGEIDAGGSISLYGNVFGKQTSRIRSTRHVKGTYIDSAIVEAQKDIVLTRGARQSALRAGGSILALGDGNAIMGGTAQASERIVAYDLGSEGEIATRQQVHRTAPGPLGTVIAKGTAYPGVTICIGGASLLLTQPMTHVMFSQTDGTIQVQALDQIDTAVPGVE